MITDPRHVHVATPSPAAARPTRILFLATNPDERVHLHIEREHREIKEALRLSPCWESIVLASEWAVRLDDLQRLLLDHRPDIVHVAGHGDAPGRQLIADRHGDVRPLAPAAAAALFRVVNDSRGRAASAGGRRPDQAGRQPPVRLVVFSSCHSHEHALAVAEHVPLAIGIRGTIMDEAAIAFGAAFYRAIGFGCSVRKAFDMGLGELTLQGLAGGSAPELHRRPVERAHPGQSVALEQHGVSGTNPGESLVFCGKQARSARKRRSLLVNLPEHSARFLGREQDVERVVDLLLPGNDVSAHAAPRGAPLAIEGMLGLGKTELAVQVACRLHERGAFAGGIYWLDAENRDLTATWGHAIADALGLPSAPLSERASLAVTTVSRARGPVLLILDNVASWSQKPAPLPQGSHISLLLTTQRHRLGGNRLRRFSLGLLPMDIARALLEHTAGRAVPDSGELLAQLGGHPLAIELAGTYLAQFPTETAAEYLQRLQADPEMAERLALDTTGPRKTLSRGFLALWNHLDSAGRDAWLLAASFESEQSSAVLADAVGLDARARRKLQRFHLLESDTSGRWRMHRVIKELGTKVAHPDAVSDAGERFIRGCERYARAIRSAAGVRVYIAERVNLDAALAIAEPVLGRRDPAVASLQGHIAVALHAMGELSAARSLMERALASATRSTGEEHPLTTRHRADLAAILRDLGELARAQELLEETLRTDLRQCGENHPRVAEHRSALAMVLRQRGALDDAHEYLSLSLASETRRCGEHHPAVAVRRGELAGVLEDLGQLTEAREQLERALASEFAAFGADHPHVAARQADLAGVLTALGDHAGAQGLLEDALSITIEWMGPGHPEVATQSCSLATALRAQGELERARELLEQALASALELHGEHHHSVAIARANLGLVLADLGELERAQSLLERALKTEQAVFHEEHPRVAACRSSLASVLERRGDLAGSQLLLERAVDSDEQNRRDCHPDVARRKVELAMVLRTRGQLSRARALLEQALEIGIRALGEDHDEVTRCRGNLAMVLRDSGRPDKAAEILEDMLAADIRSRGPTHPHVAVSRSNLAMALFQQGQLARAHELLQRALGQLLESQRDDHPLVPVIRGNLQQVRRRLDAKVVRSENSVGNRHR